MRNLRIWIIPELHLVVGFFVAVKSDLDGVTHRLIWHERFGAGHGWRTAFKFCITDNGHIHVSMVIEDALCLVKAQIHKVPAYDCDLGVAVCGSTLGFNRAHLRSLIVCEG